MFSTKCDELIMQAENEISKQFSDIDNVAYANFEKVIKAFAKERIALRHFSGTNGYGYGDEGKEALNRLFADVFEAESAIVSPNIASGTHALTIGLFGLLRPNDVLLSITGSLYDTLTDVIKGGNGSLYEFGVKYEQIDLIDGKIDLDAVSARLQKGGVKVVYLQRSRGYEWRAALSVGEISKAVALVKSIDKNIFVMVDNCYGEFIEEKEPTAVGADLVAGSLIKNPGGGIAQTGGYLVGTNKAVELVGGRLTSPSIGNEVGSYAGGYQYFYQGLFNAPHAVSQCLKGTLLIAKSCELLGYTVFPSSTEKNFDIIRSVKFNTKEELISFIQSVQSASPVDSFVTLEPWDMPGYTSQVIMAAGCFVQGASLELSADAPIKPPYIAYLQGGLTYEHCKYACKVIIDNLLKQKHI